MTGYPDIMIDIETTSTRPEHGQIFQLSAVKFNIKTQEVCPETFNTALYFAPNRYWEEGTRQFWLKNKKTYAKIMQMPKVQPKEALLALNSFAGEAVNLWSKPSHFEHPFLSSYYSQFGVVMPFHYRKAVDLNSYLKGHFHPDPVPEVEYNPQGLDLHDSLNDCLIDLQRLFDTINKGRK